MNAVGLALVAFCAAVNLSFAVVLHEKRIYYAAGLHYTLGMTLVGALYALMT